MKYIRHTLKFFALSTIALTGIMCSEKSNTEFGADTYFVTHFQDDKPVCTGNEAALNACRMERNACAFPAGKYKDSYSDEELARFKACYEEYRSCAEDLYSCPKTLKAFVLDTLTDGVELGDISPELAWDGTSNMGGVEMADRRCQTLADKNKLGGKYKAFLSSSTRDFYKEIKREYLDLPLENVHGTVLTGNITTLNDIRDVKKNTRDGMWEAIMFFRANRQRIIDCNFPSNTTYDVWTGMRPDGTPDKRNCNDWTTYPNIDEGGVRVALFDRFDAAVTSTSPIEPISQTSWKSCNTRISLDEYSLLSLPTLIPEAAACSNIARLDGLFCIQVK